MESVPPSPRPPHRFLRESELNTSVGCYAGNTGVPLYVVSVSETGNAAFTASFLVVLLPSGLGFCLAPISCERGKKQGIYHADRRVKMKRMIELYSGANYFG